MILNAVRNQFLSFGEYSPSMLSRHKMSIFDFFKKRELERIAQLEKLFESYSPIIDIDNEMVSRRKDLSDMISKREELSANYNWGHETFTRLKKEIGLFESKLDLIEYGIYEPVYDFEKSDECRQEQKRVIDQQKLLIKGTNRDQ